MSLVGDIILELRSRIPDAPAVCNPAVPISAVGANLPGGGYPPNTPTVIGATTTTLWGESTAGGFLHVTTGPTDNAIIVTLAVGVGDPPQINGINIYSAGDFPGLGSDILTQGTAGVEKFPPINGTAEYVLGVGPAGQHSLLPSRSTGFLPDTDGNFIGSYMAFRLLNRAIAEMVKIAGGIVDVTGVQSQVNQSMYRIDTPNGQGSFYTFTNAWYDGYPMDIVQRSMMYLRNSAAGFSGILSYEQDGPSSVIQVWPQSNRTGGQTFTIGFMQATDNEFFAGGPTGFLSIGLAQIDDEIIGYSNILGPYSDPAIGTYNQFAGIIRGLSGTTPAPHSPGAVVTELNIRLSGYRMPPLYQVGDSAKTLMVPQAWETPLVLHMLSQVRSMEQDEAASKDLLAQFVQSAEKIAKGSRLGRLKPRQIPVWGQTGSDARNVNGIGFGWLIQ